MRTGRPSATRRPSTESGYDAWRKRGPSARTQRDVVLVVAIRAAHERSDGSSGTPRILEDVREAGHRVGQKRVARLMRDEGIPGKFIRREKIGAWDA